MYLAWGKAWDNQWRWVHLIQFSFVCLDCSCGSLCPHKHYVPCPFCRICWLLLGISVSSQVGAYQLAAQNSESRPHTLNTWMRSQRFQTRERYLGRGDGVRVQLRNPFCCLSWVWLLTTKGDMYFHTAKEAYRQVSKKNKWQNFTVIPILHKLYVSLDWVRFCTIPHFIPLSLKGG